MENPQTGHYEAYRSGQVRRCVVLDVRPNEVLLTGSPLRPSRPGFPGDQGRFGHNRVLDVLAADDGAVHVVRGVHDLHTGDTVDVVRNEDRHRRIAHTHAAAILVQCELDRRGVGIVDVEIAAGLAWIEVENDPGPISIAPAIDADLVLHARPAGRERQLVLVRNTAAVTFPGPIAHHSGELAGTIVSRVGPSSRGGPSTLRIAVPDGLERWWR